MALCLLVPYYLFVAWKYYREDIQDWLWNRGKKSDQKLAVATEAPVVNPDELTKGLFTVQNYSSTPAPVGPDPSAQPTPATEPVADPPGQTTPPVGQTTPATQQTTPPVGQPAPAVADRPVVMNQPETPAVDNDEQQEEPEGLLGDGPAVADNVPLVIPFMATVVVPTESSLKELINVGQHLSKQDDGQVTAPEGDIAGNELAGYINQQRNKASGLEGISFTRR